MNQANALYEDAVFAYAVNAVMQIQLNELENNPELNAEFEPSPAHKKMMKRMRAKADRQEQWNTTYKPLKRIAACLIVSMALFTGVFAPVEAVQQAIITTVIEWYDKFTSFEFFSSNSTVSSFPESLHADYWPAGYDTLVIDEKHNTFYSVAYKNSDGDLTHIKVEAVEKNTSAAIDNEFTQYYPFAFNGTEAFLAVTSDSVNHLLWEKDGLLFKISTKESISEIVQIAENIKH